MEGEGTSTQTGEEGLAKMKMRLQEVRPHLLGGLIGARVAGVGLGRVLSRRETKKLLINKEVCALCRGGGGRGQLRRGVWGGGVTCEGEGVTASPGQPCITFRSPMFWVYAPPHAPPCHCNAPPPAR